MPLLGRVDAGYTLFEATISVLMSSNASTCNLRQEYIMYCFQHKGKTPTKGSKQILTENMETLKFYSMMSFVATFFYNIVSFAIYYDSVSTLSMCLNFFVIMIYVACYKIMHYVIQPRYSDSTEIMDPGLDLNMEGGMGEHIKDIVILSSITHVLAVFSNFFWLLLLLLPIRAFYLVWKHILGPWFFQEAPEDTEQDEKKRKKQERRMNRMKQ